MIDQAGIVNAYGLELVAYEGGQALVDFSTTSDDQHPNPLFYAANRDPEMAVLYTEILNAWKAAGGTLFVHFSAPVSYNKNGSWGVTEYLGQSRSEAPKYDALLNYMATQACWWAHCDNPQSTFESLDFEALEPGDYESINTAGFTLLPAYYPLLSVLAEDDNRYLTPHWGEEMSLTRDDGLPFSLLQFDVRGRWPGVLSSVDITGYQLDGTRLQSNVNYDNTAWRTQILNWTNLSRVEFYTPGGRALFDNLSYQLESPPANSALDFESVASGEYSELRIAEYEFVPTRRELLAVYDDGVNQSLTPKWGEVMLMRRSDGLPFEFTDLRYRGRWPGIIGHTEITGLQADGTELTASFEYANDNWGQITLDWRDLTEVRFSTPDGRVLLDDMLVTH
jgi:hypothetical protein